MMTTAHKHQLPTYKLCTPPANEPHRPMNDNVVPTNDNPAPRSATMTTNDDMDDDNSHA